MAVTSAGPVSTTMAQHAAARARVILGRTSRETEACSVRIFGEYSFLEDSRYTSQADSTGSCQQSDKRLLRNRYFGLSA